MWTFSHSDLSRKCKEISDHLQVSTLHPCLFSLRHGGASHDRATGSRSLLEVQQRGRWKSLDSVRRYEKHALINKVLHLLRKDVLEQLLDEQGSVASRCVQLFVLP